MGLLSNRSEVFFVRAVPGAEIFFPKRSVGSRAVKALRMYTSETYAANPNDLSFTMSDKADARYVFVNLRGDGGADVVNDFPAVSLLTTGFKHAKAFAGIPIDTDYCSVVCAVGAPSSVRLAFQFEYAK